VGDGERPAALSPLLPSLHLWFGQPAAGPATHIGKSCYVPSREVIGT
jgi:hypothetical protein